MRQTKDRVSPDASRAPHASVSHADYAALAIAHVRANGGQGIVLTERGQPAQWRAWMAYFATLNANMARTYAALKQITVPTAWPLEFDLSAPAAPMREPREEPVSPARRERIANLLRGLVASGDSPRRGAPDARAGRGPISLTLEEGRDAFADRGPPKIGEALARRAAGGVQPLPNNDNGPL